MEQVGDFDVKYDWETYPKSVRCRACGLKWNPDGIPRECPYCRVKAPRDKIGAGGAEHHEQIKEVPLFHATASIIERIRAVFPKNKKDPKLEECLLNLYTEIFHILFDTGHHR